MHRKHFNYILQMRKAVVGRASQFVPPKNPRCWIEKKNTIRKETTTALRTSIISFSFQLPAPPKPSYS